MKINYEKIKGKAIAPLDHYNLRELILAFVYDGKLPITIDHIHSGDMELYSKWCFFGDRVDDFQHKYGNRFVIALEPKSLEGCIYGDAVDIAKAGYKIISLTDALDELPNMCNILGVTPDQFLETRGLIERDRFSPHRVTLDGVIRSDNDGCLPIKEVLEVLKKAGYITEEHNKLYDLFGLTPEDSFKIAGHTYEGISCNNNFEQLIDDCKINNALIYELINNPNKIQKIDKIEDASKRRL